MFDSHLSRGQIMINFYFGKPSMKWRDFRGIFWQAGFNFGESGKCAVRFFFVGKAPISGFIAFIAWLQHVIAPQVTNLW